MTALVLVHSPFVGPSTWRGVAGVLEADGWRVRVPSLLACLSGRTVSYADLVRGVTADPSDHTVIVAHSGAGSLAPAVCQALRARGAILVDAILPHPGQSWISTLPTPMRERLLAVALDGCLPRWSAWFGADTMRALLPDADQRSRFEAELPSVPVAFAEEIAPEAEELSPAKCAFLRLSAFYEEEACRAEARGWTVIRKDWHHLAVMTNASGVASAIAKLASSICAEEA